MNAIVMDDIRPAALAEIEVEATLSRLGRRYLKHFNRCETRLVRDIAGDKARAAKREEKRVSTKPSSDELALVRLRAASEQALVALATLNGFLTLVEEDFSRDYFSDGEKVDECKYVAAADCIKFAQRLKTLVPLCRPYPQEVIRRAKKLAIEIGTAPQ